MQFSKKIDEYILTFPKEIQEKLHTIRTVIKNEAPNAIETFKYGMPTFDLYGNLVHFAGYKNHIGFYPAPSGLQAFKSEIDKFNNSKGAVQFPLDQPLPIELIQKIVHYRIKENTDSFVNGSKKAEYFFVDGLSAPAQRALVSIGIITISELSKFTKNDLKGLLGIGKKAIPNLEKALMDNNLTFKK